METDTDRQQRELYDAERTVRWSEYGANEHLEDLKDCWTFINNLMNRQSFARRYPKTHRRLAQPRNTKPIAFPQSVMMTHRRYMRRGGSDRLGGIAGGSKINVPELESFRVRRWSRDHYNWKNPTVYEPVGLRIFPHNSGGWANANEMALSHYARQKWILIHELAHVVDYNENGTSDYLWHQGHGWQFCQIFLTLTGMAFGNEAKKALRQAFQDGHVKYTRPRGVKNQCPWDPNPNREWVV